MAEITSSEIISSRIDRAGDGGENQSGDSRPQSNLKRKTPEKPAPAPPPVELDESDEIHQVDELA